MKIRELIAENDIFSAPLAGFSDAAFRAVCAEFGAAVCYSEMVSAKGLLHNNPNTALLCRVYESERLSACQLFGSDAAAMSEAVRRPVLKHFHIIDINMGCPVPKVTKCGEGSALMREPEKAAKIISALADAADRPVTVKFRKGYKGVDNAVDFAKMCADSGAAAIAVHPRFSEQMYAGEADYETVKRVKAAVKIPVILSGDVRDEESFARARDIADAVMIGRAAIGNPWIFRKFGYIPDFEEVKAVLLRQIGYLERDFSARYILCATRPHIHAYLKTAGIKAAARKEITAEAYKLNSVQNLKDFIYNL